MTTQQFRPPTHRAPTHPHGPVIEKHTTIVTPIEPVAMMGLRIFTYIVTSVAAITFIIVVLFVQAKVQAFQQNLENLFGGGASTSQPQFPGQFGN